MGIKLEPPVVPQLWDWNKSISQFFGVNRRVYSKAFGIPGHNGLDIVVRGSKMGYGTPILASHDGVVERINYDVPHQTRGNGIYILSTDKTFSTNYWHLSNFTVKVGQKVKTGEVIGTMGNSGFVKPRPSQLCPHCGTHVHFGVKLHDKSNAYKGFVDPLPYLWSKGEKLPFKFFYDMYLGKSGDDVSNLQTLLKLEGYADDYTPIGYFGMKTLRDVRLMQKRHEIYPTLGYAGYKTRKYLNDTYGRSLFNN